jgi:outer membrane protein TolC
MKALGHGWVRPGLVVGLLLAGCSTKYYQKSADHQVYSLIEAKSPQVPDMDRHFTIEQTNVVGLEGLPMATKAAEFLGPYAERELGAQILNLEDALNVGVHNSRAYQSRKEQLYLSALSLTLVRHRFTPIFNAEGSGSYGGQTEQGVTVGVDEVTGQPKIITSDNLVEQGRVSANGTVGVNWLIRDVGRLTASLTVDFVRFVTGDPRMASQSQMAATFSRPLLRNAGFKAEMEALTEAERQLVYDLRGFTQYRKEFSVGVATAFYGALGLRDAVHNNFLNLQSSRKNAERSRALAQEGRITQSDLGRLEQQVLNAESTWINSVRSYRQALDNFKFLLGLNVDINLVLTEEELKRLKIHQPTIDPEDSIRVALAARLDYLNAKDKLADAERNVAVAANFLKPQLDLGAQVSLNSDQSKNTGIQLPQPDRYSWSAGLALDPGLDRLAERNAYAQAVISRNQAARTVIEQEDQIKLQVRDSWRTLEQARRNYEISEVGVQIAERRVEEQNLLAELGRARAQDQVDAQNSLSDSLNQRTQAMVAHTIARLQFWQNLGILYIKDNGQWEEIQNAKAQ